MHIAEKLTSKNQNIEFNRPTFSKEELETVLDCLVEDLIYSGIMVERFEKEFKSTFKFKNLTTTNSLASAYHLAFLALEISEGDKVVISSFAPHAVFDIILLLKAKPITLDLEKSSFHVNKNELSKAIQDENPKLICLDHSFGCILDFKKYFEEEITIPIIEDFSEVLGADPENVKIGKQGRIGICGMSPNHVITTGNGAVLVSSDDSIIEKIKNYKTSSKEKRTSIEPKFDYNLLDFQAAIGVEQISKLGLLIERKKKIAQIYLQSVLSSSHETFFKNAAEDQFNRFPILINKPNEEVQNYFKSLQIGIEKTSKQPIHRILELENSKFQNAERLFQRGVLVPIYPNLTKDNVTRITKSIKGIY